MSKNNILKWRYRVDSPIWSSASSILLLRDLDQDTSFEETLLLEQIPEQLQPAVLALIESIEEFRGTINEQV